MSAPRPWFLAFARWYLRRRARRQLDGIHAAGLDRVRPLLDGGSVVMAANHVGWWDGPCMLLADAALGAEGRFVLDAESLRRFPFFAWLGAIPLDRRSPARLRAAFREAGEALARPGRAVWFFPQGRERPSWARPLGFQRGHELLGRRAPVVPVAIAYAFRGAPSPAAFLHFGAPVAAAEAEDAVARGLAAIDQHLEDGSGGFTPILGGAVRRPEIGLGTKILAGITRA